MAIARVAFIAAPFEGTGAIANGVFCAMLAWQVAPRMLGRGRKLRNRSLPAAVAALCAMGAATGITLHAGHGTRTALLIAILLLALLMLFMGGRIVAPAAAGQMYRQGGDLKARVQPRLEAALIACMALALVSLPTGFPGVASISLLVAAAIAAVRMARWRLWRLQGRPDLWCLASGYAWLAAGLAAMGAAALQGAAMSTALHLVTVGAMGTLTINVMALTWLRLARRDTASAPIPRWSTVLIAVAAGARVCADSGEARGAWLIAAAIAWSAAYLLLLVLFARVRRLPPARHAVSPGD